ncbi:MAG: 3-deoxy-7-phosphoheptulonate synthase [Anaerofustis sp.]
MVFVIRKNAPKEQLDAFVKKIEAEGFSTFLSIGTEHTVVCLIGNTASIDMERIVETNDIVEYAKRVTEPYKGVNRTAHPDDTLIRIGNVTLGEGFFHVISGPCSVESEEQIITVARAVKQSGATMLRGGAFKPRSSPYSFQGLHEEGIRLLLLAKKATGLPIVSEVMNISHLPLFEEVDVIQIGARNMQNFDLLKEVGKLDKPVVLKRGFANTIEEFLMSAEYIISEGNSQIILCERGIRTFETMTRNTLDLSAVSILKQKSHLPVIVDPSHAAGISSLVPSLSKAAVAIGADGLLIETHNDPEHALCDGAQSLNPTQFDDLMKEIVRRVRFEGKQI